MGRKKIKVYIFFPFSSMLHILISLLQIRTIENDRQKTVTFTRRRGGLIKKAHELAVLCECKVVLLMFDSKDECHMYSSAENPDELIGKYYSKEFHSGESKKRKLSRLEDPFAATNLVQDSLADTKPVVNEYKITTNGEGSENIQVKQVKGPSSTMNNIGINGQQCITFEPITTTADDFIQSNSPIPFSSSCVSSVADESDDPPSDILPDQLAFGEPDAVVNTQPTIPATPFLNIPAVGSCVSTGDGLISNLTQPFCFKPNSYPTATPGNIADIVDLCGSATTSPGSESPPEMFHMYPSNGNHQRADCLGKYMVSIAATKILEKQLTVRYNSVEFDPSMPPFPKEVHPVPISVTGSAQYSNQLGYFPNFDPNSINLWGWPGGTKGSFNQMVSPLSFDISKEG
ncbi:hypothetical protein K493DRAFT_301422 [Basidiobolus meristosporus CBS 931.73]|uniref:MADS-box domain-containing protein n=1 Tax=Basidiobolus meristosporus CBS 931.73 TaxID=1314790 RepID=A0A1Y1YC33_9FUNG|nr:hypothetical protein K493DRAFT_301422 [Basidiobolus meristosporus CBS 931.73]|eukprot:ORX95590.1 hypothetical protein K493DRAFT_301422 [Basidiobolus meristosporus CBS 931.73]